MFSSDLDTHRRGTITHADIERGVRRGRQLRSEAVRQFFATGSPLGGDRR